MNNEQFYSVHSVKNKKFGQLCSIHELKLHNVYCIFTLLNTAQYKKEGILTFET